LRTLAKPGTACRSPGLKARCRRLTILVPGGKADSPENARRTKSDGQKAVSAVGGEDEFLGFRLGFVVGIEWFIRKWDALVDVDEVLAIEYDTGRASVYEFRNFVFLGRGNDGLGAIYVYLPIEGWVL
jgi:hypothetical protein